MKIYQGFSSKSSGRQAVTEAVGRWLITPQEPLCLILVFHSTRQNPTIVAHALIEHFPTVPIMGCTTAGEWVGEKHQTGALVVTGIASSTIRCAVTTADNLDLAPRPVEEAIQQALRILNLTPEELDATRHFSLCLINGLSKKEELVSAILISCLPGIPIFGGSAGDDVSFKKTFLHADGRAITNGAVIALIESREPFEIVNHQQFYPGQQDVVITSSNRDNCQVYTLDGEPAAKRYAALVGVPESELSHRVFSDHPLIYECGGIMCLRPVQQILSEDRSLIFHCAIENGVVLTLGERRSLAQTLQARLQSIPFNKKFFLFFNSVLRNFEKQSQSDSAIYPLEQFLQLQRVEEHITGLDTYGEPFHGLHIHQTLVGLFWGNREE